MAQAKAAIARGTVTKLWVHERPLFLDHLLRLDPETRRERFGMQVSDDFLTRYAETTFATGGLVFAYMEDGVAHGAAELRGLDHVMSRTAEAAFSVEPAFRQRGIGTSLFERLVNAARNRRVRTLYMTCLSQNRAMQALARRFEADLVQNATELDGYIETLGPTPFTMLDEAVDHAGHFATLTLDLQRRFWPAALLGHFSGGEHRR
ncbi:MAG: GNAT family N-acetyltransferase [Bosea sp. (in: a-proteobacteria)]